jgi:hypothetical protein
VPSDVDLWDRLNRSYDAINTAHPTEPAVKTPDEDPEEQESKKRRRRRSIRILDVISVVLWLNWLTEIFAPDILHRLFGSIADYRFFFYVAVFVLGFMKFHRRMLLFIGYVVCFPLLVLFWKLPAFFIKHRSWTLFLASVQAAFTFFSDLRYNVISKGLALLATFAILKSNNKGVLLTCAVYFGYLITRSLVRLIRRTFSAPAFLVMQRAELDRAVSSEGWQKFASVPAEYRSDEIDLYNERQFNDLVLKITTGIVVTRFLYLWAYQLDRYRRNFAPPFVFNAIAYIWLFLGVGFSFAMINLAAYGIHPGSFTVRDGRPSVIAWTLYSFASFSLNEAGHISANGDLAYTIQLCAFIIGSLLLVTLLVNLVVTFRRERDVKAMDDLVTDLRLRAREQNERFIDEFAIGVEEARTRIEKLASGMAWFVTFITASIPEEFFHDRDRRAR